MSLNFNDNPLTDIPPNYKPFSFRAESGIDVITFIKRAYRHVMEMNEGETRAVSITALRLEQDWKTGEVGGEFYTNLTLEVLREIARTIEDGYVLFQTLRAVPFKDNSLERDKSIQ